MFKKTSTNCRIFFFVNVDIKPSKTREIKPSIYGYIPYGVYSRARRVEEHVTTYGYIPYEVVAKVSSSYFLPRLLICFRRDTGTLSISSISTMV